MATSKRPSVSKRLGGAWGVASANSGSKQYSKESKAETAKNAGVVYGQPPTEKAV